MIVQSVEPIRLLLSVPSQSPAAGSAHGDGRVTEYQVNMMLTFVLDDSGSN